MSTHTAPPGTDPGEDADTRDGASASGRTTW